MDRLALLIYLMAAVTLMGSFVIAALTAGLYTWPVIVVAAAAGALVAAPLSWVLAKRIKRRDPFWPRRHRAA
ncbi:hypothetical protein ACQ5SP_03295 [Rhodovulum sp. YNF3179]|uniref:hypothetical protein n=1 Tax=Rhodovulum sp. YNF3179 TaxID=3425127 RepID=UPI003D339907